MGREMTLRRALREPAAEYDLILVDCPPSLGLLTVNALVAADYALISTEAEYFSLQGVEQALEVVELRQGDLHPDLEWLGVVLNIADMRTIHAREALEAAAASASATRCSTRRSGARWPTPSRRSAAISILDHRPDLGADYIAVADEVGRAARVGRRATAIQEMASP